MAKETETEYNGNQVYKRSYTYTYEKDAEGFIKKITVDNNNGDPQSNSNAIYIINYKE